MWGSVAAPHLPENVYIFALTGEIPPGTKLGRDLVNADTAGDVAAATAAANQIRQLRRAPYSIWEIDDSIGRYQFAEKYDTVGFPNSVLLLVAKGTNKEVARSHIPAFIDQYVASRNVEVSIKRRDALQTAALLLAIPSLAVLLIGSGLVWAFSGFVRRPNP
jgi:hypothetical protein